MWVLKHIWHRCYFALGVFHFTIRFFERIYSACIYATTLWKYLIIPTHFWLRVTLFSNYTEFAIETTCSRILYRFRDRRLISKVYFRGSRVLTNCWLLTSNFFLFLLNMGNSQKLALAYAWLIKWNVVGFGELIK